MRTARTFPALIVLIAVLMTARGYSQSQTTDNQTPLPPIPAESQPSQPPTSPTPSSVPVTPQTDPKEATSPALPSTESTVDTPAAPPQAPLVWTPPPPPAAQKPKSKVIIDSRGRRVRTPRTQGRRSRGDKNEVAKTAALPAGEEQEFRIRSDVELVLLDVSVKDSRGGFVSGLPKENFKVFENKTEQEISVFQAQDVPVTVGLVVDNSGSVRPKKNEIVTAALTFVKHSNPQDEIFIINFNDQVLKGLPQGVDFTDNHSILREALLINPAQGRTALYDGLMEALDHIDKGRLDKKTIILIADGGDNMSETTQEEIIRRVEQSLATIYTVGIFNPEDKDKNPGFLKHLAEISGGEYYRPQNINHLVGVCEKIAHDVRNRYTLGYTPKNLTFDGKIRKLRVTATNAADGRQLEVRTRTQYHTPSVEESAAR
jgi:Ca-activated chloride channel homolog